MRLHSGAPPENPDFNPEAEGWRKLAFDPGPVLLQLLAIPAMVLLAVLWGNLFFLVLPSKLTPLQLASSPIFSVAGFVSFITLLIIIPVHEWIHALIHPQWGRSPNTILGIWLSKGLFYAHYEGEMSRNRFALVYLAPYLVLGLLPLGILALFGGAQGSPDAVIILAVVSLFGSLFACGDIVGVILLLFQVPGTALVRNKGWKTYWKPVP
jgi:hypothetical protein